MTVEVESRPTETDDLAGLQILRRTVQACRRSFRSYLYAAAPEPGQYEMEAPHLRGMCRALQTATEKVEQGESYYAIVMCPPQHWKSTTCAQRYPVWHLGRNPEHTIRQVSYSAAVAVRNSRAARGLTRQPIAREAFGLELDPERQAVADWGVVGGGGMLAAGFGGSITGYPADVVIIDDYCKNRQEAESLRARDAVWESFLSDVWTRRAPAHAVIIMATPWHQDDLIGRILREMEKDKGFPRFDVLRYPAWTEDYGWLFTQRFKPEFYEATQIALGKYVWQALYMCDPQPREGNVFQVEQIHYHDAFPDGLAYVRFWDPASGDERTSSDPSYTVGTKLALTADPDDNRIRHLWVADVCRGRWEAPERDRVVLRTADRDGPGVRVGVEAVGPYKDTAAWIKKLLKGVARVRGHKVQGDLMVRGETIEPIFEAAHVHVLRSSWNDAWVDEFRGFPTASHDDQVASVIGGVEMVRDKPLVVFGPLDEYADADEEKGPRPGWRDVDQGRLPETEEDVAEARRRIFDDDSAWE